MVDVPDGAEARHAKSRWTLSDRLLHGNRPPMRDFGVRGWLAIIGSQVAFDALAVRGLAAGHVEAAGWIILALLEAAIFFWYLRRPTAK